MIKITSIILCVAMGGLCTERGCGGPRNGRAGGIVTAMACRVSRLGCLGDVGCAARDQQQLLTGFYTPAYNKNLGFTSGFTVFFGCFVR